MSKCAAVDRSVSMSFPRTSLRIAIDAPPSKKSRTRVRHRQYPIGDVRGIAQFALRTLVVPRARAATLPRAKDSSLGSQHMKVTVVRIALASLLGAATWGAGFARTGIAQSSTSTTASAGGGPVTDPCLEQLVHHLQFCKREFCPNVLLNCDQQAYGDCRRAAYEIFRDCRGS